MAQKIRIERNSAGIAALLKSAEVQADLEARALRIEDAARAAGDGEFVAQSWIGGDRAQATVRTADTAARRSNAEQNVLIRSLGAGRG